MFDCVDINYMLGDCSYDETMCRDDEFESGKLCINYVIVQSASYYCIVDVCNFCIIITDNRF